MMKNNWKTRKFERYVFGLLLAVEVIMSFTFLGYVHIPPISITTAYIPIVIAACLFGPMEASTAGLLFGLGSLYKASASYVMPADGIFSPLHSGKPLQSILLSVGTRVLFGFVLGWLFRAARHGRYRKLWKVLITLLAPELHALFVYTAMGLFFPSIGFSAVSALHFERNDTAIALLCTAIVLLTDRIYYSRRVQGYRDAVNEYENNPYWSPKISVALCVISVFVLCMAGLSTVYFSNRMIYMLEVHGIAVTADVRGDVTHLQVQFLAAMLALNFILIVIILMIYRYMKYKEYRGELDYLTGIMGRKLFLYYCTRSQKINIGAKGWFLFFDLDYFKHINDGFGHSVGDEVLTRFAACLQDTFRGCGAVGRVGGDEFAALIEKKISRAELETMLTQFLHDISGILDETTVSCSIGAYRFTFPEEVKRLLTETDRVLYQAKENGRACFVVKDSCETNG